MQTRAYRHEYKHGAGVFDSSIKATSATLASLCCHSESSSLHLMRRGWKRGGGGPSARIPTGPRALAHVAAERGGGNLGSGLAANTSGGGSSSNGWGQSGGWGESPEGWGHAGWGDSTSAWGTAGELNTSAAAPSGQGEQ